MAAAAPLTAQISCADSLCPERWNQMCGSVRSLSEGDNLFRFWIPLRFAGMGSVPYVAPVSFYLLRSAWNEKCKRSQSWVVRISVRWKHKALSNFKDRSDLLCWKRFGPVTLGHAGFIRSTGLQPAAVWKWSGSDPEWLLCMKSSWCFFCFLFV